MNLIDNIIKIGFFIKIIKINIIKNDIIKKHEIFEIDFIF